MIYYLLQQETIPFSPGTQSVDLDGNDHVSFGSALAAMELDGSTPFSFYIVFNADAVSGFRWLVNYCRYNNNVSPFNTGGWQLLFTTSGIDFIVQADGYGGNRGIHKTGVPGAGSWVHLLYTYTPSGGTWDMSDLDLYRNGVLQIPNLTAPNFTGDTFTYDLDFKLGVASIDASWFDGKVFEFAFWSQDKSSDAAAIYNSGDPSDLDSFSGLEYWYRLEGDYTDSQGNGATGTPSGDPSFITLSP